MAAGHRAWGDLLAECVNGLEPGHSTASWVVWEGRECHWAWSPRKATPHWKSAHRKYGRKPLLPPRPCRVPSTLSLYWQSLTLSQLAKEKCLQSPDPMSQSRAKKTDLERKGNKAGPGTERGGEGRLVDGGGETGLCPTWNSERRPPCRMHPPTHARGWPRNRSGEQHGRVRHRESLSRSTRSLP